MSVLQASAQVHPQPAHPTVFLRVPPLWGLLDDNQSPLDAAQRVLEAAEAMLEAATLGIQVQLPAPVIDTRAEIENAWRTVGDAMHTSMQRAAAELAR